MNQNERERGLIPRCEYCSNENLECLIKCLMCGGHFCMNFTETDQHLNISHIIYHLIQSHHTSIRRVSTEQIISCQRCINNNVFTLRFNRTSQELLCADCVNLRRNFVNFIFENRLLLGYENFYHRSEIIFARMQAIEEFLENQLIFRVIQRYRNEYEYYATYKRMLKEEENYRKRELENVQPINSRVYFSKYMGYLFGEFDYPRENRSLKLKAGGVLKLSNRTYTEGLKGLIYSSRVGGKVTLLMYEKGLNAQPQNADFSINEEWNGISFDRLKDALTRFCFIENSVSRYIWDIIIKGQTELIKPILIPQIDNITQTQLLGPLNESQIAAIRMVLQEPISLVHGPPGTGKTHLIAYIVYFIHQYFKRKNKKMPKILISSPSNIACDSIIDRLKNLRNINCTRVLSRTRELMEIENNNNMLLQRKVLQYARENRIKDYLYFYNLKMQKVFLSSGEMNLFIALRDEIEAKLISKSEVVISTCIASFDDRLKEDEFPIVIIDESTQGVEPEVLLPIVHKAEHVILIGDNKQLDPVVMNPHVKNKGYNISLYERLKENNITSKMLTKQYRMHPVISNFPSMVFYSNQLQDGINTQDRKSPKNFPWKDPSKPILFIHHEGEEELSNNASFNNDSEADIVAKFIMKIKSLSIKEDQIGVITPYIGQKILLQSKLNKRSKIEINSVDGFQGREKDYIIFSCVRSNEQGEIGFLKDPRRLNVALTRAKYGLVIVGNSKCLSKLNNMWRALISYYQSLNLLVDSKLADAPIFGKDSKVIRYTHVDEYDFHIGENEDRKVDDEQLYDDLVYDKKSVPLYIKEDEEEGKFYRFQQQQKKNNNKKKKNKNIYYYYYNYWNWGKKNYQNQKPIE